MKYVLCFSGGVSLFYNYPRYQADIELMLSAILSLDGFTVEQTTVLCGDGKMSIKLPNGTMSPSIATKAGLLASLQKLGAQTQADDMLFFFASNHGGQDQASPGKSNLWCWNEEQITSDEFAQAVAPVVASVQVFVFGQCYSGGFIKSLNAPNRAVLTACQFDEVSYATSDGNHDEFIMRLATALQTKPNTLRAAFDLTVGSDSRPEHPQISDPGGITDRTDVLKSAISSASLLQPLAR